MAYTTAWDETTPSGTESMALGDNRIRELKVQIRERMNELAEDWTSDPVVFDHGKLGGLSDDDHPQYLKLDKSGQTLSQNLAVSDGVTIDGVDISEAVSDLDSRIDAMWPPPIFHARDQKTTGTEGGASTSGIQTRTLNTEVTNTIPEASLSNNQITLPAGKYKVWARCPGYRVGEHQAGLYNVTDSSYALLGSNAYVSNTYTGHSDSIIIGYLSISSQKVFELRHYTSNAIGTNGLGKASSSGMGYEIYSEIFIQKIGD